MLTVHVVEPTVCGLGHQGQRPHLEQRFVLLLPGDNGIAHHAHAVRVGQANWPLQKTAFFQPGCPGQLAVAVHGKPAAKYRVMVLLPARVQDSHAGADGVTLDQGGVADLDARQVGDGIQRAGCPFQWDAQFAGTGFWHGVTSRFQRSLRSRR